MHAKLTTVFLMGGLSVAGCAIDEGSSDGDSSGDDGVAVYDGHVARVVGHAPGGGDVERFLLHTQEESLELVALDDEARAQLRSAVVQRVSIEAERAGGGLRFRRFVDDAPAGLGEVEQAESATPKTGAYPFIVLGCYFHDVPSAGPPQFKTAIDIGRNAYPGVSHYYRSVSGNTFNLNGTSAWGNTIKIGYSTEARFWSGGNFDWGYAGNECLRLADNQGLYVKGYKGVAFVFNDGFLGGAAWGGGYWTPLEGGASLSALWVDRAANDQVTLIHEIGHGLGFQHAGTWADPLGYSPFHRASGGWCNYASKFDPMGGSGLGCTSSLDPNCYAPQLNGFHKESIGWMVGRTTTSPKGWSSQYIRRTDWNASPYTIGMVKVPIEGSRYFTLEARRRNGTNFDGTPSYDRLIPNEGVVMHHNEPNGGYWETVLIDPDLDCDSGDADAVWTPGESFTDPKTGFSMYVWSGDPDGYQVSIFRPYTLTVKATTGGRVSRVVNGAATTCTSTKPCANAHPGGTAVTLTATPSSGYEFVSWLNCPSGHGSNPCTYTHGNADRVIEARFVRVISDGGCLGAGAGGTGSLLPEC